MKINQNKEVIPAPILNEAKTFSKTKKGISRKNFIKFDLKKLK